MAKAEPASIVGKTIDMIDCSESVTIRFTDGTYLELTGDARMDYGGERYCVDAYYGGAYLWGRSGD